MIEYCLTGEGVIGYYNMSSNDAFPEEGHTHEQKMLQSGAFFVS
jgi:hypothetical protein